MISLVSQRRNSIIRCVYTTTYFLQIRFILCLSTWFKHKFDSAISAYHHKRCEFELYSWRGILDTTLCDKVCQWLATGRWFSLGTPVSSTNKIYRHDITEILLNVALNTITQTIKHIWRRVKFTYWILYIKFPL